MAMSKQMPKSGMMSVVKRATQSALATRLVKAKIILLDEGTNDTAQFITVQFNPSEYQISRALTSGRKQALMDGGSKVSRDMVGTKVTTLSVTLHFDTISDLYSLHSSDIGSAGSLVKKNTQLPQSNDPPDMVCDELTKLLTYDPEKHEPPLVKFLWGTLSFKGRIVSNTTSFTMFDAGGTPVRAKVDLIIEGEEDWLTRNAKSRPWESPDRTKERTLEYGDQLWMMAHHEYDNPGKWKIIAQANNVLNPREVGGIATKLAIPSIK